MWTHSGIFIEKRDGERHVYTSDEKELKIFAVEHGILNDFFVDQVADVIKDDGVYQCIVGYGRMGGFTDPCIYEVRKIANQMNWNLGGKKNGKT
jgi:hypothetical protein